MPQDHYAVIDLYGQCAQVSLVHRPIQTFGIPHDQHNLRISLLDSTASELASGNQHLHHYLSPFCGRSITLSEDLRTARRKDKEFEHGLVFSSTPLCPGEAFDFSIETLASQSWAGSLAVGLTSFHPREGATIPSSLIGLDSAWYISSSNVISTGGQVVATCLPMEHLLVGDVVSVRRTVEHGVESPLRFFINGRDLGVCLRGIPSNGVFVVIDLHGMIQAVTQNNLKNSRVVVKC